MHLDDFIQFLRRTFLKMGFTKALLSLVALAITISLSITAIVLCIGGKEMSWTAIAASVITPGVTAAFFSALILRLLYNLRDAEQRYKILATHDDLTGINNRRSFLESLRHEFARAKRYGVEFALVVIDLDDFKHTNDCYGHAVGDRVLQAVAQTCKATVREADVLARIGGDEFVVLVSPSKDIDLDQYIQRLAQKIEEIRITGEVDEIRVKASIGASRYTDNTRSIDDIFRSADQEMYNSKRMC